MLLLIVGFLATRFAQAIDWPDVSANLPRSAYGNADAALIVGIDDYVLLPDVPGAVQNAQD